MSHSLASENIVILSPVEQYATADSFHHPYMTQEMEINPPNVSQGETAGEIDSTSN